MDLQKLKSTCLKNRIPIVRDKTIDLINQIIDDNNFTSILEIGTAYGYSAFAFSLNPNIKNITTIEKNTDNYLLACEYLKDIKKISIINSDAILFNTDKKFDLIFIDGAKSHQEIMFEHCQKFLNNNGIIVVDNIYLKKFNGRKKLTRNQKRLISKVKAFESWLVSKLDWNVKIIDIDDGVAICKKK